MRIKPITLIIESSQSTQLNIRIIDVETEEEGHFGTYQIEPEDCVELGPLLVEIEYDG